MPLASVAAVPVAPFDVGVLHGHARQAGAGVGVLHDAPQATGRQERQSDSRYDGDDRRGGSGASFQPSFPLLLEVSQHSRLAPVWPVKQRGASCRLTFGGALQSSLGVSSPRDEADNMTTTIRRWSLLLAVIFVAALATQTAAVAQGQRYRDEVFASVDVTADIAYGRAVDEHGGMETLRLDLYEPAGDTEAARPAFVWIHGGGFSSGDKASLLEAMLADRFARRGYVVASINYRLREGEYYGFGIGDPRLPQVIADAQHDAQAAVRWLRANAVAYRIDAGRIAVGGFSAGAITALYVNYNSADPGESGNAGYPSNASACVDMAGGMDVALMDAGEPPVLVLHGTEDTTVPYQGALDIVARAQEMGVTAEFRPVEGAGHLVWSAADAEQIIGWMSAFLYRYAAPQPAIDGDAGTSEAGASDDGQPNRWLIAAAGIAVGRRPGDRCTLREKARSELLTASRSPSTGHRGGLDRRCIITPPRV